MPSGEYRIPWILDGTMVPLTPRHSKPPFTSMILRITGSNSVPHHIATVDLSSTHLPSRILTLSMTSDSEFLLGFQYIGHKSSRAAISEPPTVVAISLYHSGVC